MKPPRYLRHEMELIEREIRRADKQKQRQPLGKRMTSEAYAASLSSRRGATDDR